MPITGLKFSRLDLCDALDLAILVEEEAEERYREFAEQLSAHGGGAAVAFFQTMQANEARHGAELAQRRRERFGDRPARVTRAQLYDVEAPELDRVHAFQNRRAALTVALAAETKARDFFAAALPQLRDADVKALFAELLREEEEHIALVRAEQAKLPPGDAPPPALSDPTVAH